MFRFAVILAVTSLVLAGCGGGGEDAAAPGPPGNSAPPQSSSRVTFNKTAISQTAVGGGGPTDNSVTFLIGNHQGTFWYRYRQTGIIVEELTISSVPGNDATASGTVFIRLMNAARLGAGTYTSKISLDFCADQPCTSIFAGTPVEISVTYVVTGSALPATIVGWTSTTPYTQLEYESKATAQPTFELVASLRDVPALIPLYFLHNTSQTGLITSIEFTPPPADTPPADAHISYVVKLKAPSTLGSGVFTDDIKLRVCFDAGCVSELPGSPFDLKPIVVVLATEGVDLTRTSRAPEQGAQAISWSSATQRLYVTSSHQDVFIGPTAPADVLALDPVTLQTTTALTLHTGALDRLAVASDGNGLFVSSRWTQYVHHLQLPTLTNDYSIDAGLYAPDEPLWVRSMIPLAGQPQSVLLSLQSWNRGGGIRVYDGITKRATEIAPGPEGELATSVVPGTTTGTFYAHRRMGFPAPVMQWNDQLSVAAAGVTLAATAPVTYSAENLQFANGLFFDEHGNAIDASTGAVVRTLKLPDGFGLQDLIIDATHNRLFARAYRDPYFTRPYVMSFTLSEFRFLGMARLFDDYELSVIETHMALWGNNGLAISDGDRIVVLSGQFFTTYDGTMGGT